MSGSFTPTANSLLVAKVYAAPMTGVAESTATVTGGSLTWTKRAGIERLTAGTEYEFVQIWTAPVGASPSSMTVTITHTSETFYGCGMHLEDWTGYDTSTPVGATATGTSTATPLSITLSGAPATDSSCVAIMAYGSDADGSGAVTPSGAGWTEIRDVNTTETYLRTQSQDRTGSTGTGCAWTYTNEAAADSYGDSVGAAVEVKAATAADTLMGQMCL